MDDATLADAFVPPHDLSEAEKSGADAELKRLRMLRLGEISDNQKLYAELLRLRYLMEDYLLYGQYTEAFSFGAFLKKYLHIVGRTQKDFASEISLHPTKLNQILNGKIDVNIALVYRLEKHSGGLVPATLWWNLHAKKVEAGISHDHAGRRQEAGKVMHALVFN